MTTTRRILSATTLGLVGGALLRRGTGLAQSAGGGGQQQGGDGLRNRGAPTGRIGAATRGADGGLALDLVAPLRGIGFSAADQPTLYYLLSGGAIPGPVRLAISTRGEARPLADLELPRARGGAAAGLNAVRLADHRVRLEPNRLHVWSVAVVLDPRAPSRDLVASALIQHRPADPALERAVREAPPERRHAVLAEAGYWYDAVALAERNRDRDRGAALAELFAQAELRMTAAEARPGRSSVR